jgi:hypothetical protein
MPKQDLPELTAFARSLLRKYNNRTEVISRFCESTHMEWNEAEALVRRAEAASSPEAQQHHAQEVEAETIHIQPWLRATIRILFIVFLLAVLVAVVFLTRR